MAKQQDDYFDLLEEIIDNLPRNSLDRRVFALHAQKVFNAIKAIDANDRGVGSLSQENILINECIYDFQCQDIIESN